MFNSLKTLKALVIAKPRSAQTKAPTQDNLTKAQAKIAALKAEIESSQAEARALTQLQSEEQAKAERLRQAGADLLRIHQDLQAARAKTATAEAAVRTAAAATLAADLELHTILQSLESPAKPLTQVAKPVKLAVPPPTAAPAPTPVTGPKVAAAALSLEEEVQQAVLDRVPGAFGSIFPHVALQHEPQINPFKD